MTARHSDGRRFAIATPHGEATRAAAAVVREGGSATDAALAAAVTLSVVYPHNTGVGGDLIALVRTADGTQKCINASGPAAAAVNADLLRSRHGASMPATGVDPITVPGAVAGWHALHQLGGVLPWSDLLELGVHLADGGFEVQGSLARALRELVAGPLLGGGLSEIFTTRGTPVAQGQVLRQPALAASLQSIAAAGPAAFYRGEVGGALVDGLAMLGSPIRMHDLLEFEAEVVPPLTLALGGSAVSTAPPNSQGYGLLRILGALDAADRVGVRGIAEPQVLARLFHDVSRQRDAFLADPRLAPMDVRELLSMKGLEEAARRAGSAAGPIGRPGKLARPMGDTVAVVVADEDGNAVSLIQSLFHSFGSLVCEPVTGIVLHNRGASFSLHPESPNCVAPGKRPAHTLTPVLVTEGGRLRVAAGTMGGRGQAQILAQVLGRVFAGADPRAAVSAPRFVVGGLEVGQDDSTVHIESDGDLILPAALREQGWPVVELGPHSEDVGHTQVVTLDAFGTLRAGSDPRSDGTAEVVDR